MAYRFGLVLACLAGALLAAAPARGADIFAANDAQLRSALSRARPGDHIHLGPGPFGGGFTAGIAGAAGRPIRISGPAPDKPATFASGGAETLHLVRASYIELENIHIVGAAGNGLNCDDGDIHDFSCHHITIRHVRIDDVGQEDTANAVKLSGVSDFTITDSVFQKWGENGGCAIDCVGCKNGSIARCRFLPGRGSVAVQFKGGSQAIAVRQCLFDNPAPRGVNVGGRTDLQYFRPKPRGFEARDITIEGNIFIGCEAAIAFPNTDGAAVCFNTIYLPQKWAFRILQETTRDDFTPSRSGLIANNIIVFKSTQWLEGGINIGPRTAPETFIFAGNAWYCLDDPAQSTPRLPSKEDSPLIGRDPLFTDPAKGDFSLQPASPAHGKGHTAAPATQPASPPG